MNDRANDPLAEAHRLADANNLFIVTVHDEVVGRDAMRRPIYGDAYVVYRKVPGGRNERLFRRREAVDLLRLVRKCIGITA